MTSRQSLIANRESRLTNHGSAVARPRWRALFQRFAKFSAVGAGGVAVQTLTLALLLRVGGLHYLVATALAVEASVLHNFFWHRKWTWRDRPQPRWGLMLLRFNLTNGAMSIIANLILMFVFAGLMKLNPNAANLLAIAICSLINFTLSDRVVFV
ncbi:MAG TPA: GtrA family protein [Blastocatellia bacterium]|nr:GtrA family protein [Blastocatellia bacterium]